MIIFGWGKATNKQYGPTLALTCPNCNNDTWYHLLRHRLWLTLFFIPVIPYSSNHYLICPVCSKEMKLTRDQVDKARQMNALTGRLLEKEITESQYQFETKAIELFA